MMKYQTFVVGFALIVAPVLSYGAPRPVWADEPDRGYPEDLRRALEVQAARKAADDAEQAAIGARFAEQARAQRQEDRLRLAERSTAFELRRHEHRQRRDLQEAELKSRMDAQSRELSASLTGIQGRLDSEEFDSRARFQKQQEVFSAKLQTELAHWLAEGAKQGRMLMMALGGAFAGGAGLAGAEGIGAEVGATEAVTEVGAAEAVTAASEAEVGAVANIGPTDAAGVAPSVAFESAPAAQTQGLSAPLATSRSLGVEVYKAPARPPVPRRPIPDFVTNPEPGIEPSFGFDDLIPVEKLASGLGKLGAKIAQRFRLAKKAIPAVPHRLPATTPVGRRTPMQSAVDQAPHNPQLKVPKGKPLNAPEIIGGREFSGHALDRMAGRGVVPSVVENTIKPGNVASEAAGTIRYYDPVNKVGVVIDKATGRVITVE